MKLLIGHGSTISQTNAWWFWKKKRVCQFWINSSTFTVKYVSHVFLLSVLFCLMGEPRQPANDPMINRNRWKICFYLLIRHFHYAEYIAILNIYPYGLYDTVSGYVCTYNLFFLLVQDKTEKYLKWIDSIVAWLLFFPAVIFSGCHFQMAKESFMKRTLPDKIIIPTIKICTHNEIWWKESASVERETDS